MRHQEVPRLAVALAPVSKAHHLGLLVEGSPHVAGELWRELDYCTVYIYCIPLHESSHMVVEDAPSSSMLRFHLLITGFTMGAFGLRL